MAMYSKAPRGYLMLLAIVFGAIFLMVFGALSSFVLTENHLQSYAGSRAKALAIAEAGLEYYRWHLAHFPTDLQNGTGLPGPYVVQYRDPEGTTTGSYSLAISSNTACGQTTSVDITSTGAPNDGSGVTRIIYGRYAEPTVAQYSYIVNDSVWAGSDRIISGPYHSNGGIRMDGTANAPVTSSLASWSCTSSFGCSPTATQPGVFGAGPNQNLWSYPTPQVDFSAIAANFTTLKTTSQSSGIYLPRYSNGNSNGSAYWKGYHLIFNANGTVTVNRVTSTSQLSVVPVNSADPGTDHALMNNETNYNTYTIPASCGLIYVEDNTWVEGVVPGKVTLVVANVADVGVAPNAMLKNNITYASNASGLTLIAQNDILITPDSPDTMVVNGIFIAQNGAFGRNLYDCPSSYEPRTSLTMHGTTVSNKRTGTKWTNGCGYGDAGYQTRIDSYDRTLATNPPPFTPVTTTDYHFVDWREEQ